MNLRTLVKNRLFWLTFPLILFCLIEIVRISLVILGINQAAHVGVRLAVTSDFDPKYCTTPCKYDNQTTRRQTFVLCKTRLTKPCNNSSSNRCHRLALRHLRRPRRLFLRQRSPTAVFQRRIPGNMAAIPECISPTVIDRLFARLASRNNYTASGKARNHGVLPDGLFKRHNYKTSRKHTR